MIWAVTLKEDVTFLLKDLSGADIEKGTLERERAIQNGVHYSEMLPVEYQPSEEYIKLFHDSLEKNEEGYRLICGPCRGTNCAYAWD